MVVLQPRSLFASPQRYSGGEPSSADWASPIRACSSSVTSAGGGAPATPNRNASPNASASNATAGANAQVKEASLAWCGVSPARGRGAMPHRVTRSPSAPSLSSLASATSGGSTASALGLGLGLGPGVPTRAGTGGVVAGQHRGGGPGAAVPPVPTHGCPGRSAEARAASASAAGAVTGSGDTPRNLTDWRRSLALARGKDQKGGRSQSRPHHRPEKVWR